MMKTITNWKHNQVFESHQESQTIRVDGNKKEGPSPKALLLSGLSACSGIDVVEILEKMRVPVTSLEVVAETEQTTENPKVFKDIHLLYRVKTDPANLDKVRKAIDLSLEKYCGVSAMLKKNSPIDYKIEIA